MDTRHLVDPELRAALDMVPDLALDAARLDALRAGMAAYTPAQESYAHPDVVIEQVAVPGEAGAPDVRVIVYRPREAAGPLPALLHIHGGGYVLGEAEQSGPANVRTVREVGCLVASVDYRLAPEAPGLAALEDCYAALRWLHGEASESAVDRTRIAVGGESAGGGLAAAVALLARDRGEIDLCFQLLVYPMIDDRTALDDGNRHTGEFVWTRAANAFAWGCHLGAAPGAPDVSPYLAPARAEALDGLPPAYLCVGGLDLFLEEDLDYARRLMRAGVPVELHVVPGAYHGFELAAEARISQASEQERRRALACAFGRA